MRPIIDKRILQGLNAYFKEEETITIQFAQNQLDEYLNGDRSEFDIPLQMVGTTFQQGVWNELLKIPYGKTESYLGISRKINNEKAIRSVAAANGANAIAIFIPCHRVIGQNGKLTGYGGGLHAKKKLLQLEMQRQAPEQMELFL